MEGKTMQAKTEEAGPEQAKPEGDKARLSRDLLMDVVFDQVWLMRSVSELAFAVQEAAAMGDKRARVVVDDDPERVLFKLTRQFRGIASGRKSLGDAATGPEVAHD